MWLLRTQAALWTVAHLRAPHGVKTLEFIGEFHQNEFSPQHKEDSRYSTFKGDLFGFNSTLIKVYEIQ